MTKAEKLYIKALIRMQALSAEYALDYVDGRPSEDLEEALAAAERDVMHFNQWTPFNLKKKDG